MKELKVLCAAAMAIFFAAGAGVAWSTAESAPPTFTSQHLITDHNEGLAIGDINRDGLPDIVAGRHWFPAPYFEARPLREIAPFGRDYLENNGDHLYDVNQDGWLDVVAGSFVPSQVFWYENPGEEGLARHALWPSHLLADTRNSSNEISYLHDLNGDGRPEYIVNSWNVEADLTAWEFARNANGQWILTPRLLAQGPHGHGMGFGDINGDGREDILVARGWYECPAGDPFAATWKYHPDWEMDRAGCPILVTDLTGDGRNDLIVGSGHNYGLWWWEQLAPQAEGKTQWHVHEVDMSYSQVHALEWVDLHQNGKMQLITGKRVYAHSGKDPGADDPPGIFGYEYQPDLRKFRRYPIVQGNVGTGLQIRSADLDGDGDIDLAMPGKTGTHLIWNGRAPAVKAAASGYKFASPNRPNIVFILADDLGWADLPCYGNPFNEAPNLDRMAAEGMRFTDFYAAASICSPTRASIFSGQYPARLGMTDFVPGHWRPFERLIVPENAGQLPLEIDTPAELLKRVGYQTAYFGKWHLGGGKFHPSHQGFDEAVVTGGRHVAPGFHTSPEREVPEGTLLVDWLTDQALNFIEENREKPFFVTIAHFAVHIPLESREALAQKYRHKEKPAFGVNHPVYAAMIEDLDRNVGRLVRRLEQLGLDRNTVIVFTSDNGGLHRIYTGQGEAVTDNFPLRDEKGSLYEGGIRVPLLVRWPAGIPAGTVCREPATTVDLLPTFSELAGGDSRPDQVLDGLSLAPMFADPHAGLDREALFWHYPHYHHSRPAGCIRQGNWKLIEFFGDGSLELYNLAWDLSESHNLVEKYPNRALAMQTSLHQWRRRVKAKMPRPNPDYDPARAPEWWSRRNQTPLNLEGSQNYYQSKTYP